MQSFSLVLRLRLCDFFDDYSLAAASNTCTWLVPENIWAPRQTQRYPGITSPDRSIRTNHHDSPRANLRNTQHSARQNYWYARSYYVITIHSIEFFEPKLCILFAVRQGNLRVITHYHNLMLHDKIPETTLHVWIKEAVGTGDIQFFDKFLLYLHTNFNLTQKDYTNKLSRSELTNTAGYSGNEEMVRYVYDHYREKFDGTYEEFLSLVLPGYIEGGHLIPVQAYIKSIEGCEVIDAFGDIGLSRREFFEICYMHASCSTRLEMLHYFNGVLQDEKVDKPDLGFMPDLVRKEFSSLPGMTPHWLYRFLDEIVFNNVTDDVSYVTNFLFEIKRGAPLSIIEKVIELCTDKEDLLENLSAAVEGAIIHGNKFVAKVLEDRLSLLRLGGLR